MNKKLIFGIIVVIVLGVAYWLISPLWRTVTLDEELPPATGGGGEMIVLSQAPMTASAHDVEGQALLVQNGEERILRFENLKTINGPDLRIYLATDLEAKDFVDLGPIRATEGNVNYAIPAGTDLSKYKYAMIWCRAFSVLFSYAKL